MKLQIHVQDIQETVEVRSAAEALSLLKSEAAARAPFLVRAVIHSMSDLNFAGEVVKRANIAENRDDAQPRSAQEFLDWAVERKYATIVED
jgi:hypothetical protein